MERSEAIQNKHNGSEHLHLCSVSELPSSSSLLVEFKERIRLSKEILDKENNSAKLIAAVTQHSRKHKVLQTLQHHRCCLIVSHEVSPCQTSKA